MKLTTNHSQSSYGIPIFVNGKNPVDYRDGINWIKSTHGLSTAQLAKKLGVSDRTVDGWLLDRVPSKPALLLMKNVFKM